MGIRLKPVPVADFSVVPAGNTGNRTINQLIGNRNDGRGIATMYAYQHDNWEALNHEQMVWPSLANAVMITAHADAWVLGDFVEIVAANAIPTDFHIHHLHIHAPSANGEYELVIYVGTTEIGRVSFTRTDKKDDIEGLEIRTVQVAANSQIQIKLASSNAASEDTLALKIWYHHHQVRH